MSLALSQNKNLSVLSYVEVFWWARVDVASRASKKAPQGLFCPPDYPAGRCCSNPPSRVRLKMPGKTKTSVISTLVLLVGAGGFEPPKLKAADLQSVPIGHSGTRPYSFVCPAGRPVYFSMEGWICQHFSANFCRYFSKPGSGQKSPVGARKKGTRRGLEAHAFSYRSLRSLKNQ